MAETNAQPAAPTASIQFDAPVQSIGERLIVRLPAEISAQLPSRGQVAVNGSMNGHPFHTVVEPDGVRGHWVDVDRAVRREAAIRAGDTVQVGLAPTKEWPEPDIPGDFAAALAGAPDISEVWGSITPMARWEWVRWINATKNPVTRDRRVEVAISKLRSGKRRPCCFDLSSCTDPDLAKSGRLVDAI